jgi:DNA-directed RNA polymerase-3 subunit RPC5
LQFPLKPVFSEYPDISSAQLRPQHGRLEMDLQTPGDRQGGQQKPSTTTLASTKIEQQSCMGIGVIENGAFHITPVASVVQMRPSFQNLQTREEVQDLEDSDDEDGDASNAAPLQQVHLKRKESDRAETSRVQSFSFLQQQEAAEAWVPLRVFDPGELIQSYLLTLGCLLV